MSDLILHFRKAARNNAWSNHRLYAACAALGEGELTAPRVSFFPSISATLNHILAVDRYYIDALTEGGLGPRAFHDHDATHDISVLAARQKSSDHALIAFCDALTEGAPARIVRTDRGKAGVFEETVADLLGHVFLHQIHHRGQVHAMLSGASVKPPQLDEYFLAFDREARAADLAAAGLDAPEAIA
jgi:uncharacterized damage-inducible protein DinB